MTGFIESVTRQVRLGLRRLCATPLFTAFVATSLSLGVGVTTAVYSTLHSLLWQDSAIEAADRLAVVTRQTGSRVVWRRALSLRDFQALRRGIRSVPDLAAASPLVAVLDDGARSWAFAADAVTGPYFAMLRIPLLRGRGIQEIDEGAGAEAVVVLSHRFWQSKTGGASDVIGRTVRIGNHPFVVIGIAREIGSARDKDLYGQAGLLDPDGWVPLVHKPLATKLTTTPDDSEEVTVVARMPSGVPLQDVAAEVSGIGLALDRSDPLPDPTSGTPGARSWSVTTAAALAHEPSPTASAAGVGVVLLVGLVLVIASTNIASLTLSRNMSRAHEVGVRRALGASRARLIVEQCVESTILTACGGIGALFVTTVLLHYLNADIPLTNLQLLALRPRLSTSSLIAAGGFLLLSLIVFGVIPALHLTGGRLPPRLARGAVWASAGGWRWRRRLVASQVTFSTVFVLLAFAATRAVLAIGRHDPGFDLSHLAVAVVDLKTLPAVSTRLHQALVTLDDARGAQPVPMIESIALTGGLPIATSNRLCQFARLTAMNDASPGHTAINIAATPAIFRTLGVPIVRGRPFDARDAANTHPVVVLSEKLARHVFGTADVIGRTLRYLGPVHPTPVTVEVIGIARDTDTVRFFDRQFGAVYVPMAQQQTNTGIVVARTVGDPASTLRSLAGIIRQADPELVVTFASTGPTAMTGPFTLLPLASGLSTGLAVLSVALSMLGLYGVLSHVVASRTREIGLRLALGSDPRRIRRMIVREGMQPVIWGLGLGGLIGIGAGMVLRASSASLNRSVIDPFAYGAAVATLLVVGLIASGLPARRASLVDPNVALRDL